MVEEMIIFLCTNLVEEDGLVTLTDTVIEIGHSDDGEN